MQPENLKFGGGTSETLLHPLVLVALIIAIILMLVLRRKYLIIPVLVMAFLVPMRQQIVVAGVHLFVLRLVILAGLVRACLMKRSPEEPLFACSFNTVDKVFILETLYTVIAFLTLFSFQSSALVNRFGFLWDVLGGFILIRILIRDNEDAQRVMKTLALVCLALAVGMVNEHFRMQNVFGILNGSGAITEVRDGMVRAQATFAHPLLAGTFGATMLPFFFVLWQGEKSKFLAIIGVVSSTIMTLMAASSTPLLAYVAGIGAVCMWPLRKQMRVVRWGIAASLIGLNIVMNAPVWFLIGHVSVMGSSSSDHRAYLVDQFIRHFGNWWLIGTNDNQNWGWDMWDTSNQYVAEGETGGLVAFVCLIAIIAICFSRIGRARKAVEGDRKQEWHFWLLGAALFSNAVAFFGISYFDNIRISWYLLICMITVSTLPVLTADRVAAADRIAMVPGRFGRIASSLSPRKPWVSHIFKPGKERLHSGHSR